MHHGDHAAADSAWLEPAGLLRLHAVHGMVPGSRISLVLASGPVGRAVRQPRHADHDDFVFWRLL